MQEPSTKALTLGTCHTLQILHGMFYGASAFNQPLSSWNYIGCDRHAVDFLQCHRRSISRISSWQTSAGDQNDKHVLRGGRLFNQAHRRLGHIAGHQHAVHVRGCSIGSTSLLVRGTHQSVT